MSIIATLPYVTTLSSFQRFSTIIDEVTAGDLTGRTVIWREGFQAFTETPILGVGSNMYRSVNSVGKVAHNSFLSVLVELGLVGFLLFGLILTIVVIQAWKQPKWERRLWITMLLVWTIGATTLTWEHRKTTWLFWGLLVASAAINQLREQEKTVQASEGIDPQFVLDSKSSS
jgi:O-antigen ligase